jgi:hypothetical protein
LHAFIQAVIDASHSHGLFSQAVHLLQCASSICESIAATALADMHFDSARIMHIEYTLLFARRLGAVSMTGG